MTNITLAIEDKLLKKVRSYAKRHGSTVNGLVRKNLSDLIDGETRKDVSRRNILEMMEESTARLPESYKFDRGNIYGQPESALPKDVLEDLRELANSRNTTIYALLRGFMDDATDKKKQIKQAMDELYEMSLKTKARLGPDFKFDRASLYER
jgi:hypothetical protein